MRKSVASFLILLFLQTTANAAPMPNLQERLQSRLSEIGDRPTAGNVIFDLPLSYNKRVSYWIAYYQTKGHTWFREWLLRANRDLPVIQEELALGGMPRDLAYMVMIESGFNSNAKSHANAVGPWQFIESTAIRYGLTINSWLDERRDLKKSTRAAIHYMRDLHQEFGSWYLVAASYNMGETSLRKQIQRFHTTDYWSLVRQGGLPTETMDYVPKILAAMMIAKAPGLYGFDDLQFTKHLEAELVQVPGGTSLEKLADHLGVTVECLREMNSELLHAAVPSSVDKHAIRVPRGSVQMVAEYLQGRPGRGLTSSE